MNNTPDGSIKETEDFEIIDNYININEENQNNSEKRAYELIVNAMSPNANEKTIELINDNLHISSDNISIAEIIDLLKDPNLFKKAISKHVFVPTDAKPHNNEFNYSVVQRSIIPASPKDFFTKLFDQETLEQVNLNLEKLKEIEGNITYEIESYKRYKNIWDGKILQLKENIKQGGFIGVEKAFLDNQPLKALNNSDCTDFNNNIDEIIGLIVDNNTGKAILFLNKTCLVNYISTPEVRHNENSNNIVINKKQFSDYLNRLFGSIVIPNHQQSNDLNNGSNLMESIIIPKAIINTFNKQNIYFFLIDISGSLQDYENTYKQSIVSMIESLLDKIKSSAKSYFNPNDFIELVFFSDEYTSVRFLVKDVIDNPDLLIKTIKEKTITGNTLLKGTLAYYLNQLKTEFAKLQCNMNLFIITDGEDTTSSDNDKALLKDLSGEYKNHQIEIPKCYLFKAGKHNEAEINEIGNTIDLTVYDVNNIADLNNFFTEIEGINKYRELIMFQQGMNTKSFSVFDTLMIGPQLQIDETCIINSQEYKIERLEALEEAEELDNDDAFANNENSITNIQEYQTEILDDADEENLDNNNHIISNISKTLTWFNNQPTANKITIAATLATTIGTGVILSSIAKNRFNGN